MHQNTHQLNNNMVEIITETGIVLVYASITVCTAVLNRSCRLLFETNSNV